MRPAPNPHRPLEKYAIRYLVAIPLPEPGRSHLAVIKSALRPSGWRDTMDPHITVLAPGRPTLPPDVTSTAFAGLELNMAPFRVSAHRLHRFSRHRRHTIVLLPEDSTNLTKLFNAVVECCNWQETVTSTRRPYQPHVTLINQVSDQQLELFEQQLSSLQPLIEFDCYQLSLYAKQASWPAWQEIQRLSLDPATRRTAS